MLDHAAVLRDATTIAVVGISSNPERISHVVARYLQQAGYEIVPVNPGHKHLLGVACYPDISAIPDDIHLDIVDIFRKPEHTAEMVRLVAERAERTGNRPVVWTQLGVSSDEAAQIATGAGLPYVTNECTMATHRMAL